MRAASQATAPAQAGTPEPRAAYAPRPPPPRAPFSLAGTASLPLGASSQPGYCLSTPLFFLSDAWIPPLRADVDALLAAFAEGYPAAPRYSPCEVMRRLWEGLGWKWVHLLGVPQNGAMRGPWGDSVVRAFLGASLSLPLARPARFANRWQKHTGIFGDFEGATRLTLLRPAEHLNPSVAPLRQAAAFLALHLFILTQPASMQHIFVKIDPGASPLSLLSQVAR